MRSLWFCKGYLHPCWDINFSTLNNSSRQGELPTGIRQGLTTPRQCQTETKVEHLGLSLFVWVMVP